MAFLEAAMRWYCAVGSVEKYWETSLWYASILDSNCILSPAKYTCQKIRFTSALKSSYIMEFTADCHFRLVAKPGCVRIFMASRATGVFNCPTMEGEIFLKNGWYISYRLMKSRAVSGMICMSHWAQLMDTNPDCPLDSCAIRRIIIEALNSRSWQSEVTSLP